MEQITLEKVNENVESLKRVVLTIKEFIEDTHLTTEEEEELEEYLKNKKEKKLISAKNLRTELNL